MANSDNRYNVRLTALTTQTGDSVINSLNTVSFGLNPNTGANLRVLSGAVLTSVTSVTINSAGNLAAIEFGNREAVSSGGAISINSFVNATNGFTRRASDAGLGGRVVFNQPNAILRPLVINAKGTGGIAGSN